MLTTLKALVLDLGRFPCMWVELGAPDKKGLDIRKLPLRL
jgi:hypothetical protein